MYKILLNIKKNKCYNRKDTPYGAFVLLNGDAKIFNMRFFNLLKIL